MALTELGRLQFPSDQSWAPTMVATGSSGWSGSGNYKRVGDLIIARGYLTGSAVTYGTGTWSVGGLPATPRDVDGYGVLIGKTWFYNGARTTYGHVFYHSGLAKLISAHANNNTWTEWHASHFWGGEAGDRSIWLSLMYEAA